LLTGPDPADALHRWVEFRLAAPGAGARAPQLADDGWAGARTALTTDELRLAGVSLTTQQSAFAALAGQVPIREVTLTPAQRYRLLRHWDDRDGTVTDIALSVAADDLGLGITVVDPDGGVRHFDPPAPEPSPDPAEQPPAGAPLESRQ
jgi:hypothetical protein